MNEVEKQRFEAKITRMPDGCWHWVGQRKRRTVDILPYGIVHLACGTRFAHRVSWELHRGAIPEGMRVLHRCDVPYCVNPDHLFLGTHADNMEDMRRKGRHGGTKLSPAQVRAIRARLDDGFAQRIIAQHFGIRQSQVSRINTKVRRCKD